MMLRVLSFCIWQHDKRSRAEKVGKRAGVRAAFSLGLEVKRQYWIVLCIRQRLFSQTVEGIFHRKFKFYPCIVQRFVDVGFGDIF